MTCGSVTLFIDLSKLKTKTKKSLQKKYKPISLLQIQRLIDLGRLNPDEPIDLSSVCNTKITMVDPAAKEFGIQLTDEVSMLILYSVDSRHYNKYRR